MFKTISQLLLIRPRFLIVRFKNLVDFFITEVENSITTLKIRIALYMVGIFFIGLGIICSAASILLWGALPVLNSNHYWVLVALPMIFLFIGGGFYFFGSIYKINETLSKRLTIHMKYEINEFLSSLEK